MKIPAFSVRLLLVACAVIAAGSVTAEPTRAQQAQCCKASRIAINTSANGWYVQLPSGPAMPATVVSTVHPGWHAPIGQSQWIGNTAGAGSVTQPSGNYTYTYQFCLCNVPKGMQSPAATMSLSILADDGFIVYVNSTGPIAQTGNAFLNPMTVSVPSSAFVPGWNQLKIVVVNLGMVTGLDVSGWISGFFAQCVLTRPGGNRVPPAQPRRRATTPEQPPNEFRARLLHATRAS